MLLLTSCKAASTKQGADGNMNRLISFQASFVARVAGQGPYGQPISLGVTAAVLCRPAAKAYLIFRHHMKS
jgi:hypothetical protein